MRRDSDYFAEWFSRTLAEQGIAGGEVARAVGVSDGNVSKWKNGKATPGLNSIMRLANFLDVNGVQLAVTAGLMEPGEAGVERLPLPASSARRNVIRSRLKGVKGLTAKELEGLLDAFDDMQQQHQEGMGT